MAPAKKQKSGGKKRKASSSPGKSKAGGSKKRVNKAPLIKDSAFTTEDDGGNSPTAPSPQKKRADNRAILKEKAMKSPAKNNTAVAPDSDTGKDATPSPRKARYDNRVNAEGTAAAVVDDDHKDEGGDADADADAYAENITAGGGERRC